MFTGSPNWSGEARSSDEVWVTVRETKRVVRDYIRFTDQMFYGPAAHRRIRMMQRPGTLRTAGPTAWYELS